ncbi:hypothetical protein B0J14DRAFT_585397 [Halenospora varia]|nr:hypothetical protein B0J14DRAFT_585397 [Halenospora varia]
MFHNTNFHFDTWLQRAQEHERAYEEAQQLLAFQLWVPVPMRPSAMRPQKNPFGYIGQEREERRRQAQNDKMIQDKSAPNGTETLAQWRTTHRSAFPTQAEPTNNATVTPEEFRITYYDMDTLQQGPPIGEETEATSRDSHNGTTTQSYTGGSTSNTNTGLEARRSVRTIQIGDMPVIHVESSRTNLWRLLQDRGRGQEQPTSSHSDMAAQEDLSFDDERPVVEHVEHAGSSHIGLATWEELASIYPKPVVEHIEHGDGSHGGMITLPQPERYTLELLASEPVYVSMFESSRDTQNGMRPEQLAGYVEIQPLLQLLRLSASGGTQNGMPTQDGMESNDEIPDLFPRGFTRTPTQASPDQQESPSKPYYCPHSEDGRETQNDGTTQGHAGHEEISFMTSPLVVTSQVGRDTHNNTGTQAPADQQVNSFRPSPPVVTSEVGRNTHTSTLPQLLPRGYFMDPNWPAGWSQPPLPSSRPSGPPPLRHPDYNPLPVLPRPHEAVPLFDTMGLIGDSEWEGERRRELDEFLRGKPYMYPPYGTFGGYGLGGPGGPFGT